MAKQDPVGLLEGCRAGHEAGAAGGAAQRRERVEEEHEPAAGGEPHRAAPVADRHLAQRAAGAAQPHGARLGGDLVDRRLEALELVGAGAPGAEVAAGRGDLGQPLADLVGRELPVAARAEDRAENADAAFDEQRRRGEADGIGQRAAEAGLVAVGEHVAADVGQDDEVAAELRGAVGKRSRDRGRTVAGVQQQHGLTEVARHVRLREVKAAGPCRVGPGERDVLVERLGRAQRADPARARQRVDRPALPRQAPDDRRRAERVRQLGDDQRTHDVAPAADADGEEPLRRGDRREHRIRREPGCRRWRSRGSWRRRARTRRPRGPAYLRRAGRAAAPTRSGIRRTRPSRAP